MSIDSSQKWISGFWRRLFAITIDTLILVSIGYLLGYFFERQFAEMGGWGGYIGLAIALLYFGVMNSKFCGGQTIGKRILKIKVANKENETISLLRSCGRFLILILPFFLKGNGFTKVLINPEYTWMVSFTVFFGGVLSLLYLYVFNIKTRQCLHDIICKTYVVNVKFENNVAEKTPLIHKIAVALIFLAASIFMLYGNKFLDGSSFRELEPVVVEISSEISKEYPEVTFVSIGSGVSKSKSTSSASEKVEKFIGAEVFANKDIVNQEDVARKIAEKIVSKFPDSKGKNYIEVELIYSYDILIFSKSVKNKYRFSLE